MTENVKNIIMIIIIMIIVIGIVISIINMIEIMPSGFLHRVPVQADRCCQPPQEGCVMCFGVPKKINSSRIWAA